MTPSLPITPATPPVPIACTLGAGDFADRVSWIAELNRSALRAHRRDGLALTLDYAPEAASRVHDLVARERACCAFLAFRVDAAAERVRLTVEAPAETRDALDQLFAPFLAGAEGVRSAPPPSA